MRIVVVASALAGAILAVPAIGQTASTTCTQTGPFTNCTTTMPNNNSGGDGWSALGRAIRERRERKEAAERDTAVRIFRSDVITLIEMGRCDEAERKALDGGDLTLAMQARDYCRPVARAPMVVQVPTPQ